MMHTRWVQAAILAVGVCALGSFAATAQVKEVNSLSKTDVSASIYGAFSGTTSANGLQQSPSNSAGGIIEVRHLANPLIGFEGTYSFNHADQTYNALLFCPVSGTTPACNATQTVKANAHELTADYVPSVKVANLRPFGVLGVGLLLNEPSSGQTNTTSSNKAVFVYGAGLDWGLIPHIGLRFQYRGNLYKAPDLSTLYTSSGAFTHTAEPMIGVYFRL
jgi:opacity protein-like surface antigen